jgi:HTH-type transcriptional regulator / antitoxin HigA
MDHIKLIKNKHDHIEALARIKKLMDEILVPDSKEADELEVLSLLIEHYEQKNFPIEKPDPIEAIKFRMEQLGLLKKDLIPFIGSASKVTEVLNGSRQLSLNMIRKLNDGLGISVEVLIGSSKHQVAKKVSMQKTPVQKRSKAA